MAAANPATECITANAPNPYAEVLAAMAAVAPSRRKIIAAIAATATAASPTPPSPTPALASASALAQAANLGTDCLAANADNRDKGSRRMFVVALAAAVAANAAFVEMIEGYYIELLQKLCETLAEAEEATRRAKEKEDIIERLRKENEEVMQMLQKARDGVFQTEELIKRLAKENDELTNAELHRPLKRGRSL